VDRSGNSFGLVPRHNRHVADTALIISGIHGANYNLEGELGANRPSLWTCHEHQEAIQKARRASRGSLP
jgi:hypothetical protein